MAVQFYDETNPFYGWRVARKTGDDGRFKYAYFPMSRHTYEEGKKLAYDKEYEWYVESIERKLNEDLTPKTTGKNKKHLRIVNNFIIGITTKNLVSSRYVKWITIINEYGYNTKCYKKRIIGNYHEQMKERVELYGKINDLTKDEIKIVSDLIPTYNALLLYLNTTARLEYNLNIDELNRLTHDLNELFKVEKTNGRN